MFKFVVIAILIALSGADAFWRCCADQPQAVCPFQFQSPYCSDTQCEVTRGDWLRFWADWIPNQVHLHLDVQVTATALGVTVPLPMVPPADNACNKLYRDGVFVGCPTVPNLEHTWAQTYEISPEIPAFSSAIVRSGRLAGCLAGCWAGRLAGCWAGRLAGSLVGCLDDYLSGCSAGCSAGCSVDRLAGCSVTTCLVDDNLVEHNVIQMCVEIDARIN